MHERIGNPRTFQIGALNKILPRFQTATINRTYPSGNPMVAPAHMKSMGELFLRSVAGKNISAADYLLAWSATPTVLVGLQPHGGTVYDWDRNRLFMEATHTAFKSEVYGKPLFIDVLNAVTKRHVFARGWKNDVLAQWNLMQERITTTSTLSAGARRPIASPSVV